MAGFFDGLKNLVANLGTSRDKSFATEYTQPGLTLEQTLYAYRSSWLAKKIVNIPAMDSVRQWRDWQAESDAITLIEAEEKRLQLRQKLRKALKAARIYGGGAIYIGTDDADLMEPLAVDRIGQGGVRYLTNMSPMTLSAGEPETDTASEFYNQPRYWRTTWRDGASTDIHPSRLVILIGEDLPPDDPMEISGWGDSVLAAVIDSVKASDATMANVASLVFESKIDVIRIPEMMARLSEPGYVDALQTRFNLAMTGKGINGSLILDKDEEYDQKQTSFSSLPDVMDRFFQAVAGAADIPMTRLLGMSPGGLNASGESDTRNYYDAIKSKQELEIGPAMHRLDEALIRSALGVRPPDVHYIWSSLWQITETERAALGKTTAETVTSLYNTGLFLPEVLGKVAANTLVEDGVFPGLEAAIAEFGTPEGDQLGDPNSTEVQAALAGMQTTQGGQ